MSGLVTGLFVLGLGFKPEFAKLQPKQASCARLSMAGVTLSLGTDGNIVGEIVFTGHTRSLCNLWHGADVDFVMQRLASTVLLMRCKVVAQILR